LLLELEEAARSIESGLRTKPIDLRPVEMAALHCTARILGVQKISFRETRLYLRTLSGHQKEYERSRTILDEKNRQSHQIEILWLMLCQIKNFISVTRDVLQLKRVGATNDE